VSWQSEARLRFAVKGIAPDWIRWMCAQVGLELTALKRIRIGRIPMAGLPARQWRYLAPGERF
jgi:23S rRNA pseudouridine2604 synthase